MTAASLSTCLLHRFQGTEVTGLLWTVRKCKMNPNFIRSRPLGCHSFWKRLVGLAAPDLLKR